MWTPIVYSWKQKADFLSNLGNHFPFEKLACPSLPICYHWSGIRIRRYIRPLALVKEWAGTILYTAMKSVTGFYAEDSRDSLI